MNQRNSVVYLLNIGQAQQQCSALHNIISLVFRSVTPVAFDLFKQNKKDK